MRLVELSVEEFLNQVDGPTPTPGGGSVSALAISQGISLLRMVAHLTISKKKFQTVSEKIKLDYMSRMTALDELKKQANDLIERDTLAFNKIMDAYKIPKEDGEKRKIAIEKATIEATEIPLSTARLAYKALDLAFPMFDLANKTATSDYGVGILLIDAGLKGAVLNVKTNMQGFENRTLANNYFQLVQELEKNAKVFVDKLIKGVNDCLNS